MQHIHYLSRILTPRQLSAIPGHSSPSYCSTDIYQYLYTFGQPTNIIQLDLLFLDACSFYRNCV